MNIVDANALFDSEAMFSQSQEEGSGRSRPEINYESLFLDLVKGQIHPEQESIYRSGLQEEILSSSFGNASGNNKLDGNKIEDSDENEEEDEDEKLARLHAKSMKKSASQQFDLEVYDDRSFYTNLLKVRVRI